MTKHQVVIVADYTETPVVTLAELSDICHLSSDILQEWIAYSIIRPIDFDTQPWLFDMNQLRRAQTALRLQNDLEINLAGAALVLDLLQEIEELRARMQLMERHYL